MSTVMVSGYFDGMHSGHIRFLQDASHFGRVTVAIGCDERLRKVKGCEPLFPELERLYMVQACKYVDHAFIMPEVAGKGGVVWESYLTRLKPAYFLANDDMPEEWLNRQREACERHGVMYLVLKRTSPPGIEARSSTGLRELKNRLPYRVVLSTWMDQMQLSRLASGPCVGFSIEPTQQFEDKCGMATSTRRTLERIWGRELPHERDPIDLARIAFAADNSPSEPVEPSDKFPWGSYAARWITGSIDPITVIVPGVSRCHYDGRPWPCDLKSINDRETINWLEQVVTLVLTRPRPEGEAFDLRPTPEGARRLAESSEGVWEAIRNRDTSGLATSVNGCVSHISSMSSSYLANGVADAIQELKSSVAGMFPQGAGCGGYIACVDEDPKDRLRIQLRHQKTTS